ncbi:MAG: 2-phosphosulfolactate phosphatase [Pirellulales bacterium]|nr:2-phosphosulfolactate phosphatase [Pirellulales bacterium]
MRCLHVHLLPELVQPQDLVGWSVVVIDVLRASTTICHALDSGAVGIVPCRTIDAARHEALERKGQDVLLGGERKGVRIDGFDLGNSPADYTPESIHGKTIIFTTTNGTIAIDRAKHAADIVIGAFNNVTAVADDLANSKKVALLCAGTEGKISGEDVAAAGAITAHLLRKSEKTSQRTARLQNSVQLNDEARIARAWYGKVTSILSILRESRGGQRLRQLGYDQDIEIAAQMDSLDIVPRLDHATQFITLCSRPE